MSHAHRSKHGRSFVAAVVALVLAGCDSARDRAISSDESGVTEAEIASGAAADQAQLIDPRFIRSATAHVDVTDLDQAVVSSRELAARLGGVIAESEVSSHNDSRFAMLLLRLPSDSLDVLLREVASLGKLRSVSVSSTDVSREYFDTQTRLAVKEQTVQRLLQLVQRSASVEDLVAVERELSRATTELETLKGQIRYFDQKVAQSDVRLHLAETGGLAARGFRPVARAFADAGNVLARSIAALVYVVLFLAPWLVLGVLLWPLGRRIVRARRQRRIARDNQTDGSAT